MADLEALKQDLKSLIVNALKLKHITPDAIENQALLFGEGVGLDSLDALELAVALERHYGVQLDLDGVNVREVLRSIDSLSQFIWDNRKQ